MASRRIALLGAAVLTALAAGCGGGSNPVGNPPTLQNPALGGTGQKLSYAYFQKCIEPIFVTPLPIDQNGVQSVNTCAASGCHDTVNGTGGAFRLIGAAAAIDLTNPANTPEVIRASDMYKNFYSAQGEVVIGDVAGSRLLDKPMVRGVLHGGGLIFSSDSDPNVVLLRYWMSHPMPLGQDEFGSASATLFTPQDLSTGACNTQ